MYRRHGEGSSRHGGSDHGHRRRDRRRQEDPRDRARMRDDDYYTERERQGHRTSRDDYEDDDEGSYVRGSRGEGRRRGHRSSYDDEDEAGDESGLEEPQPRGNGGEGNDGQDPPPPSYDESQNDMQLIRIGGQPSVAESESEGQSGTIGECLDAVRKLISKVMAAKCHSCGTALMEDFSVGYWLKEWYASARYDAGDRNETPMICATNCPSCGKQTCVACGKAKPRKARSRKLDNYQISWCCGNGRLFATWVVLAQLDLSLLEDQSSSEREHGRVREYTRRVTRRHRGSTGDSRGIGYADDDDIERVFGIFSGSRSGYRNLSRPVQFRDGDKKTDRRLEAYLEILLELIPSPDTDGVPPQLFGMLELSLVIDKIAEMFRNDSMEDVMNREAVYIQVFSIVGKVCRNPELSRLVMSSRRSKRKSAGLHAITEERTDGHATALLELSDEESGPLGEHLKKLAIQCRVILSDSNGRGFRDRKGQAMLSFCNGVMDIYSRIRVDKSRRGRRGHLSKKEKWEKFHEKRALIRDERILQTSYAFSRSARAMVHSHPGRMKRLVTEAANMATSLPSGIFVRVSESRPDIIKCLIMGHPDTPYGYGLFEFDILCPAEYPHVPPFVVSRTAVGRHVFSPNIHRDGKVCLSLLGTWKEGDAAAQWQPGKSTILSVLISIQAMVFSEEPLRNEPEFTSKVGARAERASRRFTKEVQPLTIRYGMLNWLEKRELRCGIWSDVVARHFYFNGGRIYKNVMKWAQHNRLLQEPSRIGQSGRPYCLAEELERVLLYHRGVLERSRGR